MANKTFHVYETYGLTQKRNYKITSDVAGNNSLIFNEKKPQWKSITSFFMTVFLPHGFPHSVSKDYLQYQIWDSIQAFASSITGAVCTHAILKGSGVGDETASTVAATITWLLKDGTSMVGRILFAWFQGTKLDSDCKKWRLFADVANDAAMFLDLISSYFQSHFMFIICISGFLKALVGVAGGCTRAALTQHQARQNNMADVSAKDGSQETLVNLCALLCSLAIVPIVAGDILLTWILYVSMTFIHLFANYIAVTSVVMEIFNESRFKIYAKHYLENGMRTRQYLSIDNVNKAESVFLYQQTGGIRIKLGSSFMDIVKTKSSMEILKLMQIYEKCSYFLSVTSDFRTVHITFCKNVLTSAKLEALYHACVVQHFINDKTKSNIFENIESASRKFTEETFIDFKESLKKMGFNTSAVTFNIDSWVADWNEII